MLSEEERLRKQESKVLNILTSFVLFFVLISFNFSISNFLLKFALSKVK